MIIPPYRREARPLVLTGREVWDHCQVGDLRGGPPELKDHDED